tara:strand:- start:1346 stop:1675 length:330 start_codon:yes stop_codon:yes gene_type:complete
MAFKMKGSPMLRNFGISPLREEESIVAQTRTTADENLVAASQSQQGTVTQPDFEIKKEEIIFDDDGKKKKKDPECDAACRRRKRANKDDAKYYGSDTDKRKNSPKNRKK